MVPFYHFLGNKKYPVICILPLETFLCSFLHSATFLCNAVNRRNYPDSNRGRFPKTQVTAALSSHGDVSTEQDYKVSLMPIHRAFPIHRALQNLNCFAESENTSTFGAFWLLSHSGFFGLCKSPEVYLVYIVVPFYIVRFPDNQVSWGT